MFWRKSHLGQTRLVTTLLECLEFTESVGIQCASYRLVLPVGKPDCCPSRKDDQKDQ